MTSAEDARLDVARICAYRDAVVRAVSQVIVGKDDKVELVLAAFVCGGHVLLEDVPGTGKTMLLRAFARAVGGDFARIQFTPDLLPSDLTGINFYNQRTGAFEFRPGPVFANVVLADEINRATPRAQASLLEAMEERQVTVDGDTRRLPEPFMVMATQNPLESAGTFPLPDAQIDRFLLRFSLGRMTREQEMEVVARPSTLALVEGVGQAVAPEEMAYVRQAFHEVRVGPAVLGYLMDLVEATRSESALVGGASTRGAIALYQTSQVVAAFAGREFVIPEDVQRVATPALAHRVNLGLGSDTRADEAFVARIVEKTPVPLEEL